MDERRRLCRCLCVPCTTVTARDPRGEHLAAGTCCCAKRPAAADGASPDLTADQQRVLRAELRACKVSPATVLFPPISRAASQDGVHGASNSVPSCRPHTVPLHAADRASAGPGRPDSRAIRKARGGGSHRVPLPSHVCVCVGVCGCACVLCVCLQLCVCVCVVMAGVRGEGGRRRCALIFSRRRS